MLGSFNSMFSKLKSVDIVSTVTENYNKLKDKVLVTKLPITQIIPQLYHIDFPQEENVEQLVQHIDFAPYQIWNLSEYRYQDKFKKSIKDKAPFGEIYYLHYEYFSNIPFYVLVHAIGKIQEFIVANGSHRVYVHCQDSRVRSAVFLSSYIFRTGVQKVEDISDAILYVNKKLDIQLQDNRQGESSSFKSNHRIFKNIVNYHNNPEFTNPWKLKLQKIIINNAPVIRIQQENLVSGNLKIVVEVRNQQSILFKGGFSETVMQGTCICLNFQQQEKPLIVSDEFLLLVKYSWGKKIYNILRIQLNTNFIFQLFARIQQQDIDLSVHCLPDRHRATAVDLIFEQETQKSKLAFFTQKTAERIKNRQQIKQKSKEEIVDLLSGEGIVIQSTEQQKVTKSQQDLQSLLDMKKPVSNVQSGVQLLESSFQVLQQSHELTEKYISQKIQKVMKLKTEQQAQQVEDQEQDLDDYLSKLQSQV